MTDDMPTHAMSRYSAVTMGVIDKCQRDFQAERDLDRSIPDVSAAEAAIIATESLEADSLWQSPLPAIIKRAGEPLSDWSLTVLAEIFFDLADQLPQTAGFSKERQQELLTMAWTALERVLESPTASPLLWYEEIYFDVAQEYRLNKDRRALDFMKRGLAHNLRHDTGSNAENFLRDLAETYLWLDDLEQSLEILTGLLRHNPANIWTYNIIAFAFKDAGLADLGMAATRRGLALLEATGDPEGLQEQLTRALADLQESPKRDREAEVSPAMVANFRAALELDFEAGQHLAPTELARQLVSDLDQVPVKRPGEKPELPLRNASGRKRRPRQASQKLGRNDPCWCGSGKKYKQCHLGADRRRGTERGQNDRQTG